MLAPRQEEMLSYLTGLGPVGEPIETRLCEVQQDLGFRARYTYYRRLNALISKGCVKRIACGCNQTTGVLVVLKRPECVG